VAPKTSFTEVSEWCRRALGSPGERVLFEAGFLSRVFGLRLKDGREVVVKLRTYTPRLAGAAAVQNHLWKVGFPCPRLLAGPAQLGDYRVSAETLIVGGAALTHEPRAPELNAEAFADLIRSAPPVDSLPTLRPPPSWVHWDHAEAGL
jgi:hypothetical protein